MWANVAVLGWLAVSVALLAVHDTLGLPVWVALHALMLGAVTNAIVIWSEHFVVMLCRMPGPAPRRQAIVLGALNVSATAVLVGVTAGVAVLSGVGGAGVTVIAAVHTVHLLRIHRAAAMPGRFGYMVGFYCAASSALLVGAVLGGWLAAGAGLWHGRLWSAHVHLMLLGWVGLSVLGTMFILWPTTMATRIPDDTATAARRALPVLAAGLTAAAAGMIMANVVVTAAGLVCYAAGVAIAAVPLVRTAAARRLSGPAAWMLAASSGWLGVAVLLDASRLIVAGSVDDLPDIAATILPVLVLGFTVQVMMGSLTQLLPVVLGRGPREYKAVTEVLGRGWRLRVLTANAAVPMVAADWPEPVPLIGWALGAISVGTFVVLALRVAVPVALHGVLGMPAGGEDVPTPRADGAGVPATSSSKASTGSGTVSGIVAGLIVVVLVLALAGTGQDAPASPAITGEAQTVDVTLDGMRVRPNTVEVPAGTRLVLRVTNADALPHDLRIDDGKHTPVLRRGETALLDLAEVRTDHEAWCAVAGHRAAGMTMTIRALGGTEKVADRHDAANHAAGQGNNGAGTEPAGPGMDLGASPSPGWKPWDARLGPPAGAVHRVELHVTDEDVEVAPGRRERRWTFGGSVPGPVLHGRVGDRFEITLVNDGTIGHGIDFHAGELAPEGPMRTIAPGERLVYVFTATRAGAWLYHCSTAPMTQHIANGMYGAVIIDPPGLPAVDQEYLLVSSQIFLGEPGSDSQVGKIRVDRPDGWAFNGMAAQYDHAPLTARTGERVRIWLVNGGPGDATAFHVVGTQFDTVYLEGAWLLRPSETAGGAQVLNLGPSQGGFVEMRFPEPGRYAFVDHDMRHAENGAHGLIEVTG